MWVRYLNCVVLVLKGNVATDWARGTDNSPPGSELILQYHDDIVLCLDIGEEANVSAPSIVISFDLSYAYG
jgi:hypothetical protein